MATLYVVRDPPQGTFGTVNVQFTITDANETLAQDDLMPWQGIVELEDGVRFKVKGTMDFSQSRRYTGELIE